MTETGKEFFIDKDGFRIHAKLDFPEGYGKLGSGGYEDPAVCGLPEKIPVVIVVHGITGHMEERHIRAVSEAARRTGKATLRVEMYGHGKSSGAFQNHTIPDWVLEILCVIDYARSLPFAGDIYLMGHSQGGLSIMLAAALKADQLKAIIPLSPAIVIRDGCRDGELFGQKFDPDHLPERLKIGEDRYVTSNYIRTARILPVEKAIDAFRKPVLIVHGAADETVPIRYAEEAAERYQNAKLVPVPGDTHCYDHHLEVVTEAVERFLSICQ